MVTASTKVGTWSLSRANIRKFESRKAPEQRFRLPDSFGLTCATYCLCPLHAMSRRLSLKSTRLYLRREEIRIGGINAEA